MRRTLLTMFLTGACLALTATLDAQKTTQTKMGGGGSPHVRSEWTIDGANISIEYGRPKLKGRAEKELMPPGQEWRTGADEATTLKTDKALKFGTLMVPAGTYTLYTVPGATEWHLVVSKKTGQVGRPVPAGLGSWPRTDEDRQDGVRRRGPDDRDRRHRRGRDAEGRMGYHERGDSIHGRLAGR